MAARGYAVKQVDHTTTNVHSSFSRLDQRQSDVRMLGLGFFRLSIILTAREVEDFRESQRFDMHHRRNCLLLVYHDRGMSAMLGSGRCI